MKIRRHNLIGAVYAVFVFAVSLWLFTYYVEQDQRVYHGYYESLPGKSLSKSYASYRNEVGGVEPIYFVITYLCAPWISKNLLMSLLNAALAYVVAALLVRSRVHWISAGLLLVNYYLFVLYIPAERLKIGVLIFLLGLLVSTGRRTVVLWASILGHLQMIILILSSYGARAGAVIRDILRHRFSWRMGLGLVFAFALAAMTSYYYGDRLLYKIAAYQADGPLLSLAKQLPFFIGALWYARRSRRFAAAAVFIPLLSAALIVGSDRITIFSFGAFVIFASDYRRGLNFGMVVAGVYYVWQTYEFILKTVTYGYAF